METQQIKELLNNLKLLKFVKKFSADNLLEDNKMATEKFKVKTSENSISILDSSSTKLLVTEAEFGDEIYTRFNLKQLAEVLEVFGSDGEMVIPKNSSMKELIAIKDNNLLIVCPLPKKDTSKKE